MSYKYLLSLLGLILIFLGLTAGGWALFGVWLGGNFLILGIAHWRHAHHVFGKRPDGTLPLWSWTLFLPYLAYYGAVWHLLRLCSREPAQSSITPSLVVGRRLRAFELAESFDNYLDLTAEAVEPAAIRQAPEYRCFPILDGAAPTPEALYQSIAHLRPGRTFVHCAQGHGRSGLYALALLLTSGAARNVEAGLRMLQAARPRIGLNREQQRCIQAYARLLHRGESSGPSNSAPARR